MLRKILAVLGVVGCVAIAYAVNYPVTSIRDTDGHQLGINADGSLNATVDPTISSSMTINNDLAVTGSIFVPKVKGNGSTLILDPKATLLNAATFYSNGDVSIQNQIQAKYGIFTGTTTFVGISNIGQLTNTGEGSFGTVWSSGTINVPNDVSYMLQTRCNNYYDGAGNVLLTHNTAAGSKIRLASPDAHTLTITPYENELYSSSWTPSGLTLAPGSQINTSNLNVTNTGYMNNVTIASGTFSNNYSLSIATGSMANVTATPTLGASFPGSTAIPVTWIKIMIIDANGTKIPAYIPVWQ